jgi:hypothetical protein
MISPAKRGQSCSAHFLNGVVLTETGKLTVFMLDIRVNDLILEETLEKGRSWKNQSV